jgi:hypothetical protein
VDFEKQIFFGGTSLCAFFVSARRPNDNPTGPPSKTSSEDFRTGSCHLTKPIWRQRNLERLAGETNKGFGTASGRVSERSFLRSTRKGAAAG